MTNYSEAEIGALKASSQVLLFTSATVIESGLKKEGLRQETEFK